MCDYVPMTTHKTEARSRKDEILDMIEVLKNTVATDPNLLKLIIDSGRYELTLTKIG